MKILDILFAPVRALLKRFESGGVFETAGTILSNPVYPTDSVAFRASPAWSGDGKAAAREIATGRTPAKAMTSYLTTERVAPELKCRICGSAGKIVHYHKPAPMLPKGEWWVQCIEFGNTCHNITTPTGKEAFAVEAWNMQNPHNGGSG